ncbi:MAG: AAA family ATPase [Lachnospiraceae bacterium]|nr:AAA family ATPase [Lachnospiraceae bacterium]
MNEDIFSLTGSSRGVSEYTLEEIEKAEKRMKKKGGSLQDNLNAVTGRSPSSLSLPFSGLSGTLSSEIGAVARATASQTASAAKAADDANAQLAKNRAALDRQLAELNKNLAADFGTAGASDARRKRIEEEVAADFGLSTSLTARSGAVEVSEQKVSELSGEAALDAFDGVTDELEKSVFGQKEFLRKLVIAFKRPYVMPPEGNKSLNSIFLIGKDDTGRHFALSELARELYRRGILKSSAIRVMDLGVYTDASMDKIFLQDMYSALADESRILLFENFETCHPSFLAQISSLVTDGSFLLSERYVMQKGQLVNVQNSLATDTVSSFTAKGKYLVFVSEKSLDKAAGILGAPFIDSLGDVCETKALEDDAIRSIAEKELEDLTKKAEERFSFRLSYADGFLEEALRHSEKQAGLKGVQQFFDRVLQALAQARLEGDYPKGTELCLKAQDGRLMAQKEDEELDLSALLPGAYRGEIDEIRKEMDEIVGLAQVKEYVFGLEEYYRVQKRRSEAGLKAGELSKHMIFTGNPGTGKTTIARIISKYLKSIGVLSGGQLVEVSRADLVGRYVGHTAPLTNKVISQAIGGVLFIDEAYSLYRGKDDSFGLEAIDTLVKGIEDNRENLIVILAGYSNEMAEFLTANSGLKSRFPNVINFPDYTGEELLAISRCIAKSKGYVIDEGADAALTLFFNGIQMTGAADAGNGRLARNLVEEAILNQSRRLVAEPEAELSTLLLSDFELEEKV